MKILSHQAILIIQLRYFQSGVFTPLHSKETLSNAMDVGDPSNFKRVNKIFDHDLKNEEIIHAFSFTDYETEDAIKTFEEKYFCDPHGNWLFRRQKIYNNNLGSHCIFRDSSFYKFCDEIKN